MQIPRIICALCSIIMLFLLIPTASAETNVLQNSSFENNLEHWGVHVFQGDPVVETTEDGLKIEANEDTRVAVFQTVRDVNPHEEYSLQAVIRTAGEFTGQRMTGQGSHCGCFYIRLQFRDRDGQKVGNMVNTSRVFAAEQWETMNTQFTVPAEATSVLVEIFQEFSGGTVFVRDMSITAMDADTAEVNYVKNPNFQDGMNHWSVYHFTGNGNVSTDEHGLKIQTNDASERLTVIQNVRGFTPGRTHQLQASIKTENIQASQGRGAYVRLQFKRGNNVNTRAYIESETIRVDSDWTDVHMEFDVPEDTTYLVLELFMEHAHGTARFRDVVISETDIPVIRPERFSAQVMPLGAVELHWDSPYAHQVPRNALSWRVYRSLIEDVSLDILTPLAIVNETRFTDRTVRSNQRYFYTIVPESNDMYETASSQTIPVQTEQLPPGVLPHIEAIAVPTGVQLTWSYSSGARMNHLDLYRYTGDSPPDDWESIADDASFLGRLPAGSNAYIDSTVRSDALPNTWYIVKGIDPDRREIGEVVVSVDGEIQRSDVKHNYEHPYLVYTASEFEQLKATITSDISLRQIWNMSIQRNADAGAITWMQPQTLPEKDASGQHENLARTARALGLAYQFEPEREQYARAARNILMTYADEYTNYPKTTSYGGRVTKQTLNEATWLINIAWAYDLIYNYLSDDDRHHVENNLLKEATAIIQGSPRGTINWQVWHNAGLGAVAFVTQDEELIHEVMHGDLSIMYLLKEGLFADGLWWEQSIAYHTYTLRAFVWLALMAKSGGYDLFSAQVGGRTFRSMFDSTIHHAFADLQQPGVGDNPPDSTLGGNWIFAVAYEQYGDPRYASAFYFGDVLGTEFPNILLLASLQDVEKSPIVVGSSDYAPGARNDYGSTWLEATGMTVMRSSVRGNIGLGAALIYKPHGTIAGHQHADNLSLFLTGNGHQWLAGSGRFSYQPGDRDDRHGSYARHTVSKNTMVVDGVSQLPQTGSTGLWDVDGVRTSRGQLLTYVPGPTMQLTQAMTNEVYPGVTLDRTVLVTDNYVLDVYDATSDDDHTYDWIIHVDGALTQYAQAFADTNRPLGNEDGAQYVTVNKVATISSDSLYTQWTKNNHHFGHWYLGDDATEVMLGDALWSISPGQRSVFIARSKAQNTRNVSVMSPFTDAPNVHEVTWDNESRTQLRLVHNQGTDIITLPPLHTSGPFHVVRFDTDGKLTDFLLANGSDIQAGEIAIVSDQQPISLSGGIVDDVWVLHHEGPSPAQLTVSGLSAPALTSIQGGTETIQTVATETADHSFTFQAQPRHAYIVADETTAGELDLTIKIGSQN